MPILSIIIPVYNVEKYVAECLDSLFNQDIPESEYEVICVNDGSTDSSRDIVASYLPKHLNMQLIDHPSNLKLGSARNTGFRASHGKYIWHVDSDDKIKTNCFANILKCCEEDNLDVLELCFINWIQYGMSESTSLYQVTRDSRIMNGVEYVEKYFSQNMGGICSIWRRIYRREFLQKNNISSPPINMGEDIPFAIEVFGLAQRVGYLNGDYYFYRRSEDSLTGVNRSNWSSQKWYEASMVSAKYMDVALTKVANRYSDTIREKIANMITYNVSLWRIDDISDSKQYWHLCRKNFWNNLFVFKYYGKIVSAKYIMNIIGL